LLFGSKRHLALDPGYLADQLPPKESIL